MAWIGLVGPGRKSLTLESLLQAVASHLVEKSTTERLRQAHSGLTSSSHCSLSSRHLVLSLRVPSVQERQEWLAAWCRDDGVERKGTRRLHRCTRHKEQIKYQPPDQSHQLQCCSALYRSGQRCAAPAPPSLRRSGPVRPDLPANSVAGDWLSSLAVPKSNVAPP